MQIMHTLGLGEVVNRERLGTTALFCVLVSLPFPNKRAQLPSHPNTQVQLVDATRIYAFY